MIQREIIGSYGMVGVKCFRDTRVSAKSKGIYGYVMTLPQLKNNGDKWDINVKDINNHFKEDIKAIYRAINELIEFGYAERKQEQNENGKFKKITYIFYHNPLPEKQDSEKTLSQNGIAENGSTKEYKSIKSKEKKELINKDKERNIKESESVLKFWNSKDLIKHRMPPKSGKQTLESILKKLLQYYTIDDIKNTITTYDTIVNDDRFYWNHKWGLADFLVRGFERFVNKNTAISNFKDPNKVKTISNDELKRIIQDWQITINQQRALPNDYSDEQISRTIRQAKQDIQGYLVPENIQNDLRNVVSCL